MVNKGLTSLNCTPMDRASDSIIAPTKAIHFSRLGPVLFHLLLGPSKFNSDGFLCIRFSAVLFNNPRISMCLNTSCMEAPSLLYHSTFN